MREEGYCKGDPTATGQQPAFFHQSCMPSGRDQGLANSCTFSNKLSTKESLEQFYRVYVKPWHCCDACAQEVFGTTAMDEARPEGGAHVMLDSCSDSAAVQCSECNSLLVRITVVNTG